MPTVGIHGTTPPKWKSAEVENGSVSSTSDSTKVASEKISAVHLMKFTFGRGVKITTRKPTTGSASNAVRKIGNSGLITAPCGYLLCQVLAAAHLAARTGERIPHLNSLLHQGANDDVSQDDPRAEQHGQCVVAHVACLRAAEPLGYAADGLGDTVHRAVDHPQINRAAQDLAPSQERLVDDAVVHEVVPEAPVNRIGEEAREAVVRLDEHRRVSLVPVPAPVQEGEHRPGCHERVP